MTAKQLATGSVLDPNAAIRSIFRDPTWRFKASIGATFNACSLLLLVLNPMLLPLSVLLWSVVCGYMLKVMRVKIKDPEAPLPPWSEWIDLLISGLTWFAIYTGAILLVMSVLTIAMIFGAIQGSIYANDPRFTAWAITTLTLVSICWLAVALFTTYVQANFAEEERTLAAFAVRKIMRIFRQHCGTLVLTWLLAVGISALALIVPTCTIIGIAFLPMTCFVAGTICATMIAQVWRAAKS
ncbi:MAG TPA: DUF4013 domain-containing protein [Trichormus sp.]|jgi:hypothetical protein